MRRLPLILVAIAVFPSALKAEGVYLVPEAHSEPGAESVLAAGGEDRPLTEQYSPSPLPKPFLQELLEDGSRSPRSLGRFKKLETELYPENRARNYYFDPQIREGMKLPDRAARTTEVVRDVGKDVLAARLLTSTSIGNLGSKGLSLDLKFSQMFKPKKSAPKVKYGLLAERYEISKKPESLASVNRSERLGPDELFELNFNGAAGNTQIIRPIGPLSEDPGTGAIEDLPKDSGFWSNLSPDFELGFKTRAEDQDPAELAPRFGLKQSQDLYRLEYILTDQGRTQTLIHTFTAPLHEKVRVQRELDANIQVKRNSILNATNDRENPGLSFHYFPQDERLGSDYWLRNGKREFGVGIETKNHEELTRPVPPEELAYKAQYRVNF